MSENSRLHSLLPVPLPANPMERNLLIMLRRMAIHGLRDARASQLALTTFGARFHQILALSRCVLHETATASKRSIRIATCCTPRITSDEALMMDVIVHGDKEALSAVTDNDMPARAYSAALCLHHALEEISPKVARSPFSPQ